MNLKSLAFIAAMLVAALPAPTVSANIEGFCTDQFSLDFRANIVATCVGRCDAGSLGASVGAREVCLASDPGPACEGQCLQPVGDKVAPQVESTDTAVACLGSGCMSTGDSCAALTVLFASECDSGPKKCSNWWSSQVWEIEGEHKGTGTVKFYMSCGGTETVVCETVPSLPQCQDGPDSGDGPIGCFYQKLTGNPTDIIGKCVDPITGIKFEAIAAGLPYDPAAHLLP